MLCSSLAPTALLLSIILAVQAKPAPFGRDDSLDRRQLLKDVQIAACSAQLRLQSQASAFCTSFVGGVSTKTVTASTVITNTVLSTTTLVEAVPGPTSTTISTFETGTTVTIDSPVTSTVTDTTTVTASMTTTVSNIGGTCGTPTAASRLRRGLQVRVPPGPPGPVGAPGPAKPPTPAGPYGFLNSPGQLKSIENQLAVYAQGVVSSACSKYFITTPTVTATATGYTSTTQGASATSFSTSSTVVDTVTTTIVDTSFSTLPVPTVTVQATATVTPGVCASGGGLACNDGACQCPPGQGFVCPGTCSALYQCAPVGNGGSQYYFLGSYDDGQVTACTYRNPDDYTGHATCPYSDVTGQALGAYGPCPGQMIAATC